MIPYLDRHMALPLLGHLTDLEPYVRLYLFCHLLLWQRCASVRRVVVWFS